MTAKDSLQLVVERIVVHVGKIEIVLSNAGFLKALGLGQKASFTHQNITICRSIRLGRRGKVTKLIIGGVAEEHNPGTDPQLVMLLARAHNWYEKMTSGQCKTVGELAKKKNIGVYPE